DGRLSEGDQILAIDGQPLDSAITHQQAIGILQQARGEVEIVVARAPDTVQPTEALVSGDTIGVGQQPPLLGGERPSSPPSEDLKGSDMVLNTEWAQVEVIELINDGTGLGFGIIGGRSTGVVVKTILPGGVADRDGRLQSGDHILQIGEVNLLGMGSEQVAAVLRQCGSCVRLVVARPIEPTSPDALSSQAPIVPTKILGDPEELERHLMQSNGYANHLLDGSIGSAEAAQMRLGLDDIGSAGTGFDSLPEVEIVDVELRKDLHGLGITIAGYVCEKEELSGIFVKSISEGSAADVSGRISINDRIVEVDGQSLQGFTNHEAVEVLRKTGPIVQLKLERYHHGSKYDQLQSAISHSEHKPPTPSSVSALSLPQVAVDSDGEPEEILATGIGEEDEEEEDEELAVETRNEDLDLEDLEMLIDTRYEGDILPTVEAAIMAKWSKIMGADCDIVVSQLSKVKEGGGLGISLEGTVDVEDGREVRPHHYIRSILGDGAVGKAGKLLSGDELLEVNGRRLLGLNHVEVVGILKELPVHVRIVCARRPGQPPPSRPIDTSQDRNAFAARNILGGSLQNLFQGTDRLVKAKSDGSLASTGTTAATETSLSKLKSRSLEPLNGLAMWSSDPHIIELPKGDRGLGFSILDYQDPLNPSETVIVIRSLVPGGVAQQDGRLIPGDRLLAVNEINLENASLDQAVQALKGAPKGVVRIAVAKPLPLPDTTTLSSFHSEEDALPPPPLPSSPPPDIVEGLVDDRIISELLSRDPTQGLNQVNPMVIPVSTERLIPSYRSDMETVILSTSTGNGTVGSSSVLSTILPLPSALERNVKIKKEEDQLGMTVEVIDGGINGGIVTALAKSSPIAQDGRIRVGDYILSINNESLRNLSNSQVKAILRQAQFSTDLSISYIPSGDAEVHKQACLIQLSAATADGVEVYEEERLDRVSTRTPADGEESTDEPIGGGVTTVTSSPSSSSSAGPISGRSQVGPNQVGSSGGSSVKRDQSLGGSPPSSVSSPKSVLSANLSPPKHIETSTVYINTSEHHLTQPPQPQIQKRVVTHVTIFPSPPPEVAQVVPVVKRSTVSASSNSVSSTSSVPTTTAPPATSSASPPIATAARDSSTVGSPPESVAVTGTASATAAASLASPTSVSNKSSAVTRSNSGDGSFCEENTNNSGTVVVRESHRRASESADFVDEQQSESAVVVAAATTTTTTSTTRVVSTLRIDPEKVGESILAGSGSTTPVTQPGVQEDSSMVGVTNSEREYHAPVSAKSSQGISSSEDSALLLAKHWGPERLVEVLKEPAKSLGISIVGGKVDLYNAGPDSGSAISGIFIKNVLANSPAGRTGQLKTGDRILAVDDVDLRSASHERAVEVIRAAGNPVRFLVQSLVQWSDALGVSIDESETSKSEETDTHTTTRSQSQSQSRQSEKSTSSRTKSETTTTSTTDTSETTSSTTRTVTGTGTSSTGTCSSNTENGKHSGSSQSETMSSSTTDGNYPSQRKRSSVNIEKGNESDEGVENEFQRAMSPDDGLLPPTAPAPVSPARTPSPELIQVPQYALSLLFQFRSYLPLSAFNPLSSKMKVFLPAIISVH
ncbi:unnamed protein product, partial [Allacma fusca]